MRYFLTGRHPESGPLLVVESGSRALSEKLIQSLRGSWCGGVPIDVATCFPGAPQGLWPDARVWRPNERRNTKARLGLLREMSGRGYTHMAVLCSGEPFFATWKWALTLAVPAKVSIVNENGDYFWLDVRHLGALGRFLAARSGLAGSGAVRTLGRVLTFPVTLAYLALFAAAVHLRRAVRVGFGRGPA